MDILTAAEVTNVPPSMLRYYERIGFIPPIKRNKSGGRIYTDKDIEWIKLIQCMRQAGLHTESLIDYTKLCNEGDNTLLGRIEILVEEKENLIHKCDKINETVKELNVRIEEYKKELEAKS